MPSPLIAVTGRRLRAGRITRWTTDALASPAPYAEGVERAGGTPAVLLPHPLAEAEAASRMSRFDGLLLTGGADVDPARYGQEAHPETYGVDSLTDDFEFALVRAALAAEIPVLAICRGIQVLNVALGGTLDQHIAGRPGLGLHGVPNGGEGSQHGVRVEPGTRLHKALGAERAHGASHHHQALDRIGDGLVVTAWADDGIIEGAELDGPGWCVAVQWHPEETAGDDPVQQGLFDSLVAEAS